MGLPNPSFETKFSGANRDREDRMYLFLYKTLNRFLWMVKSGDMGVFSLDYSLSY